MFSLSEDHEQKCEDLLAAPLFDRVIQFEQEDNTAESRQEMLKEARIWGMLLTSSINSYLKPSLTLAFSVIKVNKSPLLFKLFSICHQKILYGDIS